ncbi:MAG: xanthine dehydrogenase family protein molybdopterin-binding subunit [Alphaproteobacteria bacterium]|nr:xanthine dehydrogenase family protein molybdopterin-binding subunit [Alphaproteobacteria bacterium]
MEAFTEKFGVGQPVRRKEDQRLLIGGGRYTDDFNFEGQAYLAFLRSPYAHGRISEIDTEAAKAAPGVLGVFTGADMATDGVGRVETDIPLTALDGTPIFKTQRLALPTDKVRYAGEPVAVVVAETAYQARDAMELIGLDVEQLPPVVTALQAATEGAAAVHDEKPDNCALHWENDTPDAYEAVAAKAHKIVTIELTNNRVVPVPMEPKCCTAEINQETGRMTIYAPFQGGRRVQGAVADLLFGGDGDKVRQISDNTGGGFGTRSKIYPEIIAICYAAKKLRRTVKWLGDRSETMVSDLHGRDQVNSAALAFDENGKILGYRLETYVNIGAWVTENGARLAIDGGGRILGGCYDIPVLYYSCRNMMTNTVSTDTYRGAGRPEANYIVERLMEKAAKEFGIDSRELRRRNFITDFPYTTQMGMKVDCGDFAACMDMALKDADWENFAARRADSEARGKLRGIGLASFVEGAGGRPEEIMRVRFEEDGSVNIYCGTYSHGQGHATVYSQILSDKLGVPFESINLIQGDTDTAPEGASGTYGSRSSQMGGVAIIRASDIIIEKGKKIAAHLLQAEADDVTFEDGDFKAKVGSVTMQEVARAAYDPARLPDGLEPGLDETYHYTRDGGRDDQSYPNGCHICEVEVDPDTGDIELLAYSAADDCGTVLNPLIVHGQVHGGVAQGIGQALTEHLVYDEETGQLLTGSFMDYGMPRAKHLSDIKAAFNPIPSTNNELGVKGAGEAGCCGAPPAFVNAVLNALEPLGVKHLDMPLTPNNIWHAIHNTESEGASA